MEDQQIVLLDRTADVHKAGLLVEPRRLRQNLRDVLIGPAVDDEAKRASVPMLADQHDGLPEIGVFQLGSGNQKGPPADLLLLVPFHSFYYNAPGRRLQPR